jgi:CheY-like chemotaxis protein
MSASLPTQPDGFVTVLVVDDARDNAEILALWLGHRGFRVICRTSGEAALASVGTDRPDVAILDLMIPGWTPVRLVDALEAACGLPRTHVLFLTGADSDMAGDALRATRCAGVLYKPVSFDALERAIRSILEGRDGTVEVPPPSNASHSA